MPFFGQRLQGFGQNPDLIGPQRQLTGFGAKRLACKTDDVAQVKLSKLIEQLLADPVAGHINLNPPLAILNLDEGGLAEITAGHNASGEDIPLATTLQGFGVMIFMGGNYVGGGMINGKIVGVGVGSLLPEFLHFLAALQENFVKFFHKFQYLSSLIYKGVTLYSGPGQVKGKGGRQCPSKSRQNEGGRPHQAAPPCSSLIPESRIFSKTSCFPSCYSDNVVNSSENKFSATLSPRMSLATRSSPPSSTATLARVTL